MATITDGGIVTMSSEPSEPRELYKVELASNLLSMIDQTRDKYFSTYTSDIIDNVDFNDESVKHEASRWIEQFRYRMYREDTESAALILDAHLSTFTRNDNYLTHSLRLNGLSDSSNLIRMPRYTRTTISRISHGDRIYAKLKNLRRLDTTKYVVGINARIKLGVDAEMKRIESEVRDLLGYRLVRLIPYLHKMNKAEFYLLFSSGIDHERTDSDYDNETSSAEILGSGKAFVRCCDNVPDHILASCDLVNVEDRKDGDYFVFHHPDSII